MPEVVFEGRYAFPSIPNPNLVWLRELILHPSQEADFGDALLTFGDRQREATLILIGDPELGFYLNYESRGDTWLSVGDRTRLAEVVCPDDWQASAGLFVPRNKAWHAISEFCTYGTRSQTIEWIRPGELPQGGNY